MQTLPKVIGYVLENHKKVKNPILKVLLPVESFTRKAFMMVPKRNKSSELPAFLEVKKYWAHGSSNFRLLIGV